MDACAAALASGNMGVRADNDHAGATLEARAQFGGSLGDRVSTIDLAGEQCTQERFGSFGRSARRRSDSLNLRADQCCDEAQQRAIELAAGAQAQHANRDVVNAQLNQFDAAAIG
jgi:hypothetical protein